MNSTAFVNRLLTVNFIIMAVTGIMAHPFSDLAWLKILHALSGLIFCIGIVIHIRQHGKKVKERDLNVS